jgi:hypothetical protein
MTGPAGEPTTRAGRRLVRDLAQVLNRRTSERPTLLGPDDVRLVLTMVRAGVITAESEARNGR